ncbi:hypothetical protein FIBSPDRAFT_954898 [Athelia psychrophila]|uniref:Uncharacterized protein n=1 Tax=Athelia psychrophila TaxID=1759441 RepID=A0A166IPV5_9AGAM|nr:hypothetical protein FIBSPDRAFT_954898 [Fibularhizoctonia sp. CBS 109695]
MTPHTTLRSGRMIRRSTSLPPSPRREAAGATLHEEAADDSEALSALSDAQHGLVPEREVSPSVEIGSEEDGSAQADHIPDLPDGSNGPYDAITGPNEYESPRRHSRAVVIRTVWMNGSTHDRTSFPEWFAQPQEEIEIKQEEVSYDWAESNENDPLPDISNISHNVTGVNSDLRSAHQENDILRERMSKIARFRDYDEESTSPTDPESSDGSESTRSRRSSSGKYKRPPRPRIGVFSMRPTDLNDRRSENQERIPFHSKGKWPLNDPGRAGPSKEQAPGRRAWDSQELEEHLNARDDQVNYEREYTRDLQEQADTANKAETRHLEKIQLSYRRTQCATREDPERPPTSLNTKTRIYQGARAIRVCQRTPRDQQWPYQPWHQRTGSRSSIQKG